MVARVLLTIKEVTKLDLFQAQPINVLFDSGATHFFISVKLVETLGLVPTHTYL